MAKGESPSACRASWTSRAVWAALLAVHLIPLARLTGEMAEAPSGRAGVAWLLVVLTATFFFLKLLDAPWLRWRWRRGGLLTLALASLLVHNEVVVSDAGRSFVEQSPAILATGLAVGGARRLWKPACRAWNAALRAIGASAGRLSLILTRCSGLLADCVNQELRSLRFGAISPRAPPQPT